MKKFIHLKNVYLIFLYTIFAAIVFVPFLSKYLPFFNRDYEEFLLLILFSIGGYYFFHQYKKEVALYQMRLYELGQSKNELGKKFNEAFTYIGNVNILIQEIKLIFTNIKKYPENGSDIKSIMENLSGKILSITTAKWVHLKIIDLETKNTISQHYHARENIKKTELNVNNNDLINHDYPDILSVLASSQENYSVKIFCIMPKIPLTNDQKVLLGAIINQIEMLFLISVSTHYRNNK